MATSFDTLLQDCERELNFPVSTAIGATLVTAGTPDTDPDVRRQKAAFRGANEVLREIDNEGGFSDLKSDSEIRTVAAVTDGTVTVTADSATVVGTSTTFTTWSVAANDYLRYAGQANTYNISSVTGETTLTLRAAYVGSTASSSYAIFRPRYSLASDVEEVYSVAFDLLPTTASLLGGGSGRRSLKQISMDELSSKVGLLHRNTGGVPTHYALDGRDSSGYIQIYLHPYPDSQYLIPYRYYASATLFTSGASTSPLPTMYDELIKWGIKKALTFWADDPRHDACIGNYRDEFARMFRREMRSRDGGGGISLVPSTRRGGGGSGLYKAYSNTLFDRSD